MRRLLTCLLAVSLIAVFAGAATAQEKTKKRDRYLTDKFPVEADIFGGVLFQPGGDPFGTGGVAGARIGTVIWHGLGAELEAAGIAAQYEGDPNDVQRAGAVNDGIHFGYMWSLGPIYHIGHYLDKNLVPYARANMGIKSTTPPPTETDDGTAIITPERNDLLLGIGGGVKYYIPVEEINEYVAVRFDVRYIALFDVSSADSGVAAIDKDAFDSEAADAYGSISNFEMTLALHGYWDWYCMFFCEEKAKRKDSDGDGLYDDEDDCIDQPGPPSNRGCPVSDDRDGDGVLDKDDKCPDDPGLASLDGCPDRDGDGVADKDDKCPDDPGPASNKGCPKVTDRDGDGIPDDQDKCPDKAEDKNGYQDEDGCPEGGKPDQKKAKALLIFSGTIEGVNFLSGKATLTKESKPVLDKMAGILKEYPDTKIIIEGHTDSQGSDKFNKKLSQRRAESVRTYLISKGVAPDRMKAVGFGEERPVADNKTRAGRAKNRRIEVKVDNN